MIAASVVLPGPGRSQSATEGKSCAQCVLACVALFTLLFAALKERSFLSFAPGGELHDPSWNNSVMDALVALKERSFPSFAPGGELRRSSHYRHDPSSWNNYVVDASVACEPQHVLAPGLARAFCASPLALRNESAPATCGGIPLVPDSCLVPAAGKFEPPEPRLEDRLVRPLRLGGSRRTPPVAACTSSRAVLSGAWVGSNGTLAPDEEWRPHTCSLAPLDAFAWTDRAAADSCTAQSILIMGDSHMRNLFTALVAGVRGRATFAEGHLAGEHKKDAVHLYRFVRSPSSTFDSLTTVPAKELLLSDDKDGAPSLLNSCRCGEERCVSAVFIWAPSFIEQVQWLPHIKAWQPDVVAVSPANVYSQTVMSPAWLAGWESALQELPRMHLSLVHWPYGATPKARQPLLEAWEAAHPGRVTFFSEHAWNRGKQGSTTFHFACSLTETHGGHSDTVVAYEDCTDVSDTMMIRAVVTVAGWW